MWVYVIHAHTKFEVLRSYRSEMWHILYVCVSLHVTLTFCPWNWSAIMHVSWGTLLPILVTLLFFSDLWVIGLTRLRLITWPCDLGGHGACGWCGSSSAIRIPSLKFVCLAIRKIWRTICVSINRPAFPDLWPWNWYARCI